MKISVLRKMEYEGTFIYINQFDLTFQYLVVWKNEIFQDRIEWRPAWWRVVLYRLGIVDSPYNQDMIDEAEQIILSGAMKTVDALKQASRNISKKEKHAVRIRETT